MLDPTIQKFFEDRKEAWLKKNIKASMDEFEEMEKKQECEQIFSFENWLPSAAKRAGQISMSSHPCTFSHPSARKNKNGYVTSILCDASFAIDGFLKTGNTTVETDALGNAAALDVYKFLTIELSDKKRLIEHIEQETDLAKKLLEINSESYSILRDGFLEMIKTSSNSVTSSKIKQVYFPVLDNYHQLSILTNSGMIYELRKRIDNSRFSEQVKEKRELRKKGEYSEQGYMEFFNLTTIGFGGTKPQNISVLNNQNGGKSHLLSSTPPKIQYRSIRFPKTNFFKESFHIWDCQDVFQALHKIFVTDYNNINIREGRDYRIKEILDRIVQKMWAVRAISEEQYSEKQCKLKQHQKKWLCPEYQNERENSDDWLEKLSKEITSWITTSYKKVKGAKMLSNDDHRHILKIITENKEALR